MTRKPVLRYSLAASLCLAHAATVGAQSLQHEQALAHFKSGKEKLARDAVWTAPAVFKVGVLDNSTPRDGYALYVCSVLAEFGFAGRNVWVQVIDIAKLKRTGAWTKLGEARCK